MTLASTYVLYPSFCKGTAWDYLDNLVGYASASVPMDSQSPWSIVFFSLVQVCYQYHVALLGIVVINVLICVAIATGAQTRLV